MVLGALQAVNSILVTQEAMVHASGAEVIELLQVVSGDVQRVLIARTRYHQLCNEVEDVEAHLNFLLFQRSETRNIISNLGNRIYNIINPLEL